MARQPRHVQHEVARHSLEVLGRVQQERPVHDGESQHHLHHTEHKANTTTTTTTTERQHNDALQVEQELAARLHSAVQQRTLIHFNNNNN